MREGWFGPKRIGWGVGPSSWQGWLVVLALIAGVIGVRRIPGVTMGQANLISAGLVVLFLVVMVLTYRGRPR